MAVKERPILFSAEMVRAVIDRRKTQTRRVVKPQPDLLSKRDYWQWKNIGFTLRNRRHLIDRCPYGQPGDRLWVRETWYDDNALRDNDAKPSGPDRYIEYRADHDCSAWEAGCPCSDEDGRSCWRPSIYMPRWASRIDLEVTGVRVERVQEIGPSDCRAEGIGLPEPGVYPGGWYRSTFATLWNSINARRGYSWESNPWVWVVSFRRIRP